MHPLRFWLLLSVATVGAVSRLPAQAAPSSPQAVPEKSDVETARRQAAGGAGKTGDAAVAVESPETGGEFSGPDYEPGPYGLASLLLEKGDLEAALRQTRRGITKRPESVRLRLMEADLLERLGRHYSRRRKLREAAETLGDLQLLRELAETEELFGPQASSVYAELADAFSHSGPVSSDYLQALRRGLFVSLRDGNLDKGRWFTEKLRDAGGDQDPDLIGAPAESSSASVDIPGGPASLARMVDADPASTPERFFADYCRAIIRINAIGDPNVSKDKLEGILKHFERVAELRALAAHGGDAFTLALTVSDEAGRQRSRKILHELGWKLRYSGEQVRLDPGEGAANSIRQQTASALAIDEIGMQEALEQGRDFQFAIPTGSARLLFGEQAWRRAFHTEQDLIGGFAEALARDTRLAKLYVGLSEMDERAAVALVQSVGLERLNDSFADLLHLYSSAITIENGRAFVPGGESAERLWADLVSAPPDDPAGFYLSLLKKDGGKMLAFFFTLAQLDHERQRFFTLSPTRIRKFYRLFREAPELGDGSAAMRGSSFAEFFREIPLDAQGKVYFPGSPKVWMVARGEVSSGRLTGKLSRVAPPELEDEILLRLARTRFETAGGARTQLEKFVAVARIDARRSRPLDEISALMLAQNIGQHEAAYPYFAVLTGLDQDAFRSFFEFSDKVKSLPLVEANQALGEFHALTRLLGQLQESGALREVQAADLFVHLCESFTQAATPGAFAAISLNAVRQILEITAEKTPYRDPDQAIRYLLLGPETPVSFSIAAADYQIDTGKLRHEQFEQAVDLQRVTSLKTLLRLADALEKAVQGGPRAGEHLDAVASHADGLLTVEIPKSLRLKDEERQSLQKFEVRKLRETIDRLRRAPAKEEGGNTRRQIASELMDELNPHVALALSGIVYAYFLSPDDLLVSEDPLLLRRHRFVSRDLRGTHLFPSSRLQLPSPSSDGSYLRGGFADFPRAAGQMARYSMGASAPYSEHVADAQFACLRATDWSQLREHHLRLFGLKILLAREWIVQAAITPPLRRDLAESTLGPLSLKRRRSLLAAIERKSWRTVWDSVTLSDLYFLAGSYQARYTADPWESPVTLAVRRMASSDGDSGQQWLGCPALETMNLARPQLAATAPYEEYARYVMPSLIGERVAEFKLYLALQMDRTGVPAAAMGTLAMSIAPQLLRELRMNDLRDWQPVVRTFSTVD